MSTAWLDGQPYVAVFLFFLFGAFARSQALYWIGRGATAGTERATRGRWLSGPRFDSAVGALHRWGAVAVAAAFLTIGVQSVIHAAAGVMRMPWLKYTLATVPGAIAWAAIYTTIGFTAFYSAGRLAARSPWALAALIAVTLALGPAVLLRRRSTRLAASPEEHLDA